MEKREIYWMLFISVVGGSFGTTLGVILGRWIIKMLGLDI
jgi:hypothetical protein